MVRVGGNDSRRQTQARFSAHERSCRRRHRRDVHRPRRASTRRPASAAPSRCRRRPAQPVDAVFAALEGVQACAGRGRATSSSARRSPRTACSSARRAHALPDHGGLRGRAVHPAHRPQGAVRPAVAEAAPRTCGAATASASRERVASDGGVRMPLEDGEVERVVELVARPRTPRTPGVAVADQPPLLLRRPAHERLLADALARGAARRAGLASRSEVAPIWREYERGNTTIVDAYLRRLVGRVRRRARGRARGARAVAARASC